MKKIVLIGDSIRMGYDKYVKDALADVAEVYYPTENCRYATNVLRFLHEWRDKGAWGDAIDLVHWNAGLWDCLELFGDTPLVSLPCYGETIARIDKRIRLLFPKARVVFATSTSVDESRFADPEFFFRHNSTIEEYNAAALHALKGTDTRINDLYTVSTKCPPEYHSDAVHYYTDGGTALLGGKVLSIICDALDIPATEIRLGDFTPERYAKDSIGF